MSAPLPEPAAGAPPWAAVRALLAERLAQPLPGWAAQRRMAPRPGEDRSRVPTDPGAAKQSAVLALLAPDAAGHPTVLITLRSEGLNTHKGQLSLPGGRIEPAESVTEAALRETHEEVGLPPEAIAVVGALSPLYIPPSRSVVHPVVGLLEQALPLRPAPSEVQEAFWLPLPRLADPATYRTTTRELLGQPVEVPYWDVHPTPLWGATAIVLAELLEVLELWRGPIRS